MFISKLKLVNFRNHDNLTLQFEKGLVFITGDNAQGKTNIVEAISLLSFGRSFRTKDDEKLVKQGEDFAIVEATIEKKKDNQVVQIVLMPDGKKILVNGQAINRFSELIQVCNVLVFEPRDTILLKDSPRARRSFLDASISKTTPDFVRSLSLFDQALQERNELLKGISIDPLKLKVATELLIKTAEPIVNARSAYVDLLNSQLTSVYQSISGRKLPLVLSYNSFTPSSDAFTENATAIFEKSESKDIKRRITTIGPQHDDFVVYQGDIDITSFGSQSENRLATLCLKLAPYFLKVGVQKENPIVILDDVMSELDEEHQKNLLDFLSSFEQVFVTGTTLARNGAQIYEIVDYKVNKRSK
jgi:DNA replication and repair protein RecF